MADEATGAGVATESSAESSSEVVSSPTSELGASSGGSAGASFVTQTDFDAYKRQIQSSYDRMLSQRDKENVRLKTQIGALSSDLQMAQAKLRAPDPDVQPREASQYWEKEAQKANLNGKTEMFIANQLLEFAQRTGVVVTRDDARLEIRPGPDGGARFRASLERIEKSIKDAEANKGKAEKERQALRDEIKKEVLKEAGIASDVGAPVSSTNGLTMTAYLAMTGAERRKLKRENPAAIDAAMARGR